MATGIHIAGPATDIRVDVAAVEVVGVVNHAPAAELRAIQPQILMHIINKIILIRI